MDIEIDGVAYRTFGTINTIDQFMVAKRLGPVVGALGTLLTDPSKRDFDTLLPAIVDGISKIPDDDCLYVFDKCLGMVQRKEGDTWVGVWNRQARQLQYASTPLPTMLRLVFEVIQEVLGSFTPAPDQPSQVAGT